MSRIVCNHDCRFEYIISQLEPYDGHIFAVYDGYLLKILTWDTVPPDLFLEMIKSNPEIKSQEYHYRSRATDSTYVFFDSQVHDWLQNGREPITDFTGRMINLNTNTSSAPCRTLNGT